MYEKMAWNSFCKTGDINSYLEYTKFKDIVSKNESIENDTEKIVQDLEVITNEFNKSQGNSDKGSSI